MLGNNSGQRRDRGAQVVLKTGDNTVGKQNDEKLGLRRRVLVAVKRTRLVRVHRVLLENKKVSVFRDVYYVNSQRE